MYKNGFAAYLILVLLVTTGCVWGQEKALYVSPGGSDANPGTLEKPFRSLEKARDTIREKQLGIGGVTVYLRGGTYYLEKTFELGAEDSGEPGRPVVYKAWPDETPILHGGRIVKGWRKLDEPLPGVDPNAAGHLWYCDIQKGRHPHFLWVNGESRKLASYPNDGFLEGDEGIQHFGPPEPAGQQITFPESIRRFMPYLPDNGDVEMSWIPIIWANGISVLRDFDAEANTARRHSKNVLYKGNSAKDWMRGNRFKLLNAPIFIDTPGEWCVDTEKGRIYLWPVVADLHKAEVIAPELYELVRIEGDESRGRIVHDIVFEGITFTGTDRLAEDLWPDEWLKRNFENPDAAVFIRDAENITIKGNRIIHVGTYGVTLNNYARHNHILGNEIAYTGCGGVQLLGYGAGTKDVNKNNVISRNLIHHCGNNEYMHSCAISLYQSGENEISYNYIYETPFSAIMIVGPHYTHINDLAQHSWWPENDKTWKHTDAYGQAEAQYQNRWHELPEGTLERARKGTGTFTHQEFTRYLHARENRIAYNIVSKNMQGLADGGAMNSFAVGRNNHWKYNLIHKSRDKTIYLDTASDFTVVEGNCAFGEGGTINANDDCRSFWKDNHMCPYERPLGYNELFHRIKSEVDSRGGWLGRINMTPPALAIGRDEGKLFSDTAAVRIQGFIPGAQIRYTLDGSEPNRDSELYAGAFELKGSAVVKAAAFRGQVQVGETDRITFTRIESPAEPDLGMNRKLYEHNDVPYLKKVSSFRPICYDSKQFQIRDTTFLKGLVMYKQDQIICPLEPRYKKFVAMIGIDDLSDIRGYTVFQVLIDGESVFESDKMSVDSVPYNIQIDIPAGSRELVLKAREYSDFYWVYGLWISPGFLTD